MADSLLPVLVATNNVRHAEVAGCRVILDLRSEQYSVLDHIASVMWRVLTGDAEEAAAMSALTVLYAVSRERLQLDLRDFQKRCIDEKLLEAPSAPSDLKMEVSRPVSDFQRRRIGTLSALRTLIATGVSLSRDGFAATYQKYSATPRGHSSRGADRALSAFCRAENLFLSSKAPEDCLPRSLALFRFLNQAGISAEHLIGVRRFPFQAHAWVEIDGQPALHSTPSGFVLLARM